MRHALAALLMTCALPLAAQGTACRAVYDATPPALNPCADRERLVPGRALMPRIACDTQLATLMRLQ